MSQISQQFDHVYREWMVRPELELAFNIDNVKVNLKKLDKQILIECTIPGSWDKGKYDLDKVLYYTLISAEHYPAAPAIRQDDGSLWLTLLIREETETQQVVETIEKVVNQVDTWHYLISYDD